MIAESTPKVAPLHDRSGLVVAERYRLQRRLGAGGMGEVYEAKHTELPRRFAVKFLRAELAQDPTMRTRFKREAHAAAALVCDHVVEVADFGYAHDGSPFIAMELLEGIDLRRLLNSGHRSSVSQAVQLMVQTCLGAEAAHAQAIVHRDLKPENLFLARRGDRSILKILDFGIAKLLDQPLGTGSNGLLGTPAYMAPEQLRSGGRVDHRADIYALGVIAYELLTGCPAHSGEGQAEIITHVLFERPTPIRQLEPDVPEALAAAIEKACAPDPDARFQSARELRAALEPFAGSDALVLLLDPPASPPQVRETLPAHASHAVTAINAQRGWSASVARRGRLSLALAASLGLLLWMSAVRTSHTSKQGVSARLGAARGAPAQALVASSSICESPPPTAAANGIPWSAISSLSWAESPPTSVPHANPVAAELPSCTVDSCTSTDRAADSAQVLGPRAEMRQGTGSESLRTKPRRVIRTTVRTDVGATKRGEGSDGTQTKAPELHVAKPQAESTAAPLIEIHRDDETILFKRDNPLRAH